MQATVHTAIKRRLRPHNRWILEPFLRSTLQNCLSSRRQIHHTGRRDVNKRQLQLDTMHADEPTLTKASQKCKIALGTLRNFCGASLVQQLPAPEVYQNSGGAGSSIKDAR